LDELREELTMFAKMNAFDKPLPRIERVGYLRPVLQERAGGQAEAEQGPGRVGQPGHRHPSSLQYIRYNNFCITAQAQD
jgi:hypothetical protein